MLLLKVDFRKPIWLVVLAKERIKFVDGLAHLEIGGLIRPVI